MVHYPNIETYVLEGALQPSPPRSSGSSIIPAETDLILNNYSFEASLPPKSSCFLSLALQCSGKFHRRFLCKFFYFDGGRSVLNFTFIYRLFFAFFGASKIRRCPYLLFPQLSFQPLVRSKMHRARALYTIAPLLRISLVFFRPGFGFDIMWKIVLRCLRLLYSWNNFYFCFKLLNKYIIPIIIH